ncbi:MAG: MotA/TolQ/ExbB proton channel family protein [Acidobacteria bacterium]|nr:MAG: MotA/TolQ/ExbB proton channel family protein [Acidobacteriota bacterium]
MASKKLPVEFLYQVASLIIAIIVVHAVYVTLVRPRADRILAEQTSLMEADPDYVQERSVWVIVRDFEQEACFILMFWAIAIMGAKTVDLVREGRLLDEELVPLGQGIKILPEDAREYARQIEALPPGEQHNLVARALLSALNRFGATRSIQDASETARDVCETEADRLESELAMVRYIAWAIPSIGFIGTVRGIGEALGKAHQAVEGQIAGVTQSLGVAFNSTFIALLISIVLMFLLQQLQLQQERLVLDTETYLDTRLVRHLRVGSSSEGE